MASVTSSGTLTMCELVGDVAHMREVNMLPYGANIMDLNTLRSDLKYYNLNTRHT